jgi:Secretion system C-terminal sorting domain
MKKLILLFVTYFTMNLVYCQFTAIPDPNFEAFLEANGMGDGIPNNGQVLTSNIENVTVLDLPSAVGISDLTGIEDFLAVEFLDCSFNLLTNINLSQNLALKTFGCVNNQLIALDLSNNTQLEWVSCQGNQLTSLLLNSANLTVIECFDNGITSLDISQAVALTFLDCNLNQIPSLDTSQNTNLIQLVCWSNSLTSLNTSNNVQLTYLNCGRTNIDSLDLSSNSNLTNLVAPLIEELTFLDLRNGNNASMSVSAWGTDDLRCIFVDDAGASYLDDWMIDPFTTFVNNEGECDALSIPSLNEYKLVIYPNPALEFITISLRSSADYMITAANGILFKKGQLKEGLNKISMANLSTGLYFIRVTSENGIATKKIIKR